MAYSSDEIEKIFDLIIERIEEGEALHVILKEPAMPSSRTFYKWLQSDELKVKIYAGACEVRGDAIFDEILEIADQSYGDKKLLDNGDVVIDAEFVARSRIRIDARKWVVSKLNPKKYGDTVDLTSGGVALTGIDFNVISKK